MGSQQTGSRWQYERAGQGRAGTGGACPPFSTVAEATEAGLLCPATTAAGKAMRADGRELVACVRSSRFAGWAAVWYSLAARARCLLDLAAAHAIRDGDSASGVRREAAPVRMVSCHM